MIRGSEPEFSVASGLAYCGRIDEELREFKAETDRLISSTAVEDIVALHMDELYRNTVDAVVDPILQQVALPAMDRWRDGPIEKLSDMDGILEREIDAWLHSEEGRLRIAKTVADWLRIVSYYLEEHTMPICVRHGVPYSALSLTSYLSLSEIDIHVETKELFAVEEMTWLIDAVVSIVVGLLCGGSGVALIAGGLQGIRIGIVVSALILALGKDHMQQALLHVNLPKPIRKLIPKSYLRSRADRISREVRESLYTKLEKEKNAEITERLVREISEQIEGCLVKMAQVVEIPLG